ncbi:MAG: hypothetical protein EYC62_06595 [Alphaproteobacteria bacterium]|nr:MAG: hypothetical protein EYC62_06595 [Alphaproteobacteria bacterium]
MSNSIEPVAIYKEGCGPDDGMVTIVTIPEAKIDHDFCRSIDPQSSGPFSTDNFTVTVHSSAKFWEGKKIEGEMLEKLAWVNICGFLPYVIPKDKFQLLSLQYLENKKSIALKYTINGKPLSQTLKLQDSGEKQREVCG